MKPLELQTLIRDLLVASPLPGLASVGIMPSGTVRAGFGDNARIFAQVAHAGPATRQPAEPTWPPLQVDAEAPAVVNPEPAAESVRVSYLASYVTHQLRAAGDPRIAAVGTFAELGLTGPEHPKWPPCGVAVKGADGTAVYVSFNGTSGDGGNDTTRPAEYIPEVSSGQVS